MVRTIYERILGHPASHEAVQDEGMQAQVRGKRKDMLGMLFPGDAAVDKQPTSITESHLQTYTGRLVDPTHLSPEDICDEDIAHSLSMLCRFAGHCNQFYSVAQHSIYVSQLCDSWYALHGLLHDASEAYLVDIPSPVKYHDDMAGYRVLEYRAMETICERYGIDYVPAEFRHADRVVLISEARMLFRTCDVKSWCKLYSVHPSELIDIPEAWPPGKAEAMFLSVLRALKQYYGSHF